MASREAATETARRGLRALRSHRELAFRVPSDHQFAAEHWRPLTRDEAMRRKPFYTSRNHANGRHTIEIYDAEVARLTRRATLANPALLSPNDLVAVTPTQVYVTNDHRHPTDAMRSVEEYLRRPRANVVMWDGQAFREASGGIQLANGINVSHDGKTLYVASVIGQAHLRS